MISKQLIARRTLMGTLFLVALNGAVLAQSKNASTEATRTVIRSDQEAPLVLFVLPWEESTIGTRPPAPMSDLLPVAVDNERTLAEDHDAHHRPLSAIADLSAD